MSGGPGLSPELLTGWHTLGVKSDQPGQGCLTAAATSEGLAGTAAPSPVSFPARGWAGKAGIHEGAQQ